MPVKIEDMEMPKSCNECKLTTPCASYCFCKAKGQRVEMGYDKHRMSWCPLQEVKE